MSPEKNFFKMFFPFLFLSAASVSSRHRPLLDHIEKCYPVVASTFPELVGTLDKLYTELEMTFSKGLEDAGKAFVYRRVDASALWVLLCKENASLEKYKNEIKNILSKIDENINISTSFLRMSFHQYTYLGCFLRSLTLDTDIRPGPRASLNVLTESRKSILMEMYLDVHPNSFHTNHLIELATIYGLVRPEEAKVNRLMVDGEMASLMEMRTAFFYYIGDSTVALDSNIYQKNEKLPKFIKSHIKPARDLVTVDGKPYLSKLGLAGGQIFKYWLFLVGHVPDRTALAKYFDDTLTFGENMTMFRTYLSEVYVLWLNLKEKELTRRRKEDLRNLCCTYDFLYNYNKLLDGDEYDIYDFMPMRNALLRIIKESNI